MDWVDSRIDELVAEHGAVPPPWFLFPDTHPYDICWRMGAGESHVMVFEKWWEREMSRLPETERIEWFRRWPPPPRWLQWMITCVWDLRPWDLDDPDSFDYSPYFARIQELGFASETEFQQDLADPRWLREDG